MIKGGTSEVDKISARFYFRAEKRAILQTFRMLQDFSILLGEGVSLETLQDMMRTPHFQKSLDTLNEPTMQNAMKQNYEFLAQVKRLYGLLTDMEIFGEAYDKLEENIRSAQRHHGCNTMNLRAIARYPDVALKRY